MRIPLQKFVHIIVPHEKNGHIPHILRTEFIVILIVFVGALFYFHQNNFVIIKKLNLLATVYPYVLADLANQDRGLNGVSKLTWSPSLEEAAKLKAEDMLKNSYFAHTSPSGVTPWHWLKKVNYNFIYAGENLAVDFTESVNVENAWLNSPKHRENILNSHFTEIGIATADGVFEGKETTFVVQFLGYPSNVNLEAKTTTDKEVIVEDSEKIEIPGVAGVYSENIFEKVNEEPIVKIIEEKTVDKEKFIVVKNENAKKEASIIFSQVEIKPISTWYARWIMSPTKIIKLIYIIILSLVLISVSLLFFFKDREKKHTKCLSMGMILSTLIIILLIFISVK